MDKSDTYRDAIEDAIQSGHEMSKRDGAILTGWCMVTEWMTPDGERWLAKGHAANITMWQAKGMHHEAVYGDWPSDD